LAFRRCMLGIDAKDPDDLLLDWLWAFLNHPTWVVSAHLPGNDLPAGGGPQLDLAACEMAGNFAELREALKPWMDSVSDTLADTIVYEIDRRVLAPFVNSDAAWWFDPQHQEPNNWTGVCGGTILCACESLAAQGLPRPAARERARAAVRRFVDRSFTPGGECDEGLLYWTYGVGYACMGLSRLSFEELADTVDYERFRLITDYPARAHLFGDTFFSGNDAGLTARNPLFVTHWLGRATDNAFLRRWPPYIDDWNARNFMTNVRMALASAGGTDDAPLGAAATPAPAPARLLKDQQAGLFSTTSPAGRAVVACLSGGHNDERHNHNDLGTFLLFVDGKTIVPDIGAPHYSADFFGPKRYTYLSASSRGHCSPVVNGHVQRPGGPAVAGCKILAWDPAPTGGRLSIDATAAYPPAAKLESWTRQMVVDRGTVTLADAFRTAGPGTVEHVVWSEIEPTIRGREAKLGPATMTISPGATLTSERIDPQAHNLRDYKPGQWLYRLTATYATAADGSLDVETRFVVG
ncbi:MAG TPA: heparinase II/III family protein, partial [Tepidisphaeraceae bacterium]|nr:heparinase II/III family protein [Tepidisphaeraceae bacterium]